MKKPHASTKSGKPTKRESADELQVTREDMGGRREERKRHHRSRKPCRKDFFFGKQIRISQRTKNTGHDGYQAGPIEASCGRPRPDRGSLQVVADRASRFLGATERSRSRSRFHGATGRAGAIQGGAGSSRRERSREGWTSRGGDGGLPMRDRPGAGAAAEACSGQLREQRRKPVAARRSEQGSRELPDQGQHKSKSASQTERGGHGTETETETTQWKTTGRPRWPETTAAEGKFWIKARVATCGDNLGLIPC
jgi:hypothetical protein